MFVWDKKNSMKEGFSMERVKLKCGTLHHIMRNTGEITDCIFAKLLHNNNSEIGLTYDCISGNLVVHRWYELSESELNDATTELKDYFATMV